MSERGIQLQEMANRQIAALIDLFSTRGDAILSLPCPGREKLGDGSVAACASHTADSYDRIAGFVDGRAAGVHGGEYLTEDVDRQDLLGRLSAAGLALNTLADLTDEQLDAVPAARGMKFCDGHRTLERILTNLLRHQGHSVDALKASVAMQGQ
jgi:hypothetical protein